VVVEQMHELLVFARAELLRRLDISQRLKHSSLTQATMSLSGWPRERQRGSSGEPFPSLRPKSGSCTMSG